MNSQAKPERCHESAERVGAEVQLYRGLHRLGRHTGSQDPGHWCMSCICTASSIPYETQAPTRNRKTSQYESPSWYMQLAEGGH